MEETKKAYLASGCFWGMEELFLCFRRYIDHPMKAKFICQHSDFDQKISSRTYAIIELTIP